MSEKNRTSNTAKNAYDDGNIPEIDLPGKAWVAEPVPESVEPLPESTRPRKDGPGGEDNDQ